MLEMNLNYRIRKHHQNGDFQGNFSKIRKNANHLGSEVTNIDIIVIIF